MTTFKLSASINNEILPPFRKKVQSTSKMCFNIVIEAKLENILLNTIDRTEKVEKGLFYEVIVENT